MITPDEAKVKRQEEAVKRGEWFTCVTCEYFTKEKEPDVESPTENGVYLFCNKWKACPPIDVIVVGCPEYINHIPF